jgi:hypothetical protein
MADNVDTCSMSQSGKNWENAAAHCAFSSVKIEQVERKDYRPPLKHALRFLTILSAFIIRHVVYSTI